MSRAGKFIPGGSGNKAQNEAGDRTGPIRAPEPGSPPGAGATGGKRTPAGGAAAGAGGRGSSLIKPVAKSQKMPIVVMSAVVCCLLVSFAWYEFAVLPMQRQAKAAQDDAAKQKAEIERMQEDIKKKEDERLKAQSAVRGTLIINTKPQGALVTVGDVSKPTPASFGDLIPGKVKVSVHLDGYHDFTKEVEVAGDKPLDLGTVELTRLAGSVSLTTQQDNVQYTLTGPNDYSRDGQLPDKLDGLAVGDYQLTVSLDDWKLPVISFSLTDGQNMTREIKFPFATATITSTPSGATVRQGHTVLGKTPLTLPPQRPTDLHLSVDLFPYTIQRIDIHLTDGASLNVPVTLKRGKDFAAACGIDMVWIPDGEFWAGKYEVSQAQYETIIGSNPSAFRKPNRPVDSVPWEAAKTFCDKLNEYEARAGKLPQGYHYALPTESQWATFSADADIDQAAMSRGLTSLSSTQDIGASEPNKYGIYDSLGNVWEWCSDTDDKGFHSLRGGCWLSSPANFPNADTRIIGAPKYADRFIGFRVVLVPNS